jgi:hypothetical protein
MSIIKRINENDFGKLFIDELGWSLPRSLPNQFQATFLNRRTNKQETFALKSIAEYKGLSVWAFDDLPEPYIRRQIAKSLSKSQPASLLVFTNGEKQFWVWPEGQNRPGVEARLTAQRHSTLDPKNVSLETRLKLLNVRTLGNQANATDILNSLRNAFNADAEAAVSIADLHDALVELNGPKTELEVFLTRLLFIFFGDDTELFGPNNLVNARLEEVNSDGTETSQFFDNLMAALGTKKSERPKILDDLIEIEYVNGGLFTGVAKSPTFNARAQKALLVASAIEWGSLSPAIFGAMFQGVLETLEAHIIDPTMDFKASREELGAHYTSEPNILKVIDPLFLEDLRSRFKKSTDNVSDLLELQSELSTLTFLDPACGCGNFLVVTYRELRHLEHDVLARLIELGDSSINPDELGQHIKVDIDQFFGIEIVESAAQIAKVALWISDHQMNKEAAERFGSTRETIPLRTVPHIVRADALSKPWDDVLPSVFCSFVIGNPPFLGSRRNSQKDGLKAAVASLSLEPVRGIGDLDLVAGWFALATKYAKGIGSSEAEFDFNFEVDEIENVWWKDSQTGVPARLQTPRSTSIALVATNSITQGEQVSVLWPLLFGHDMVIGFAYRSFKWTNDAPGMAAVHCVILGLHWALATHRAPTEKRIYINERDYEVVRNISPYLIEGSNTVVSPTESSLWLAPRMSFGNQPIDGGFFQMKDEEYSSIPEKDKLAIAPFLKKYVGSRELMNGEVRRVLWLPEISKSTWSAIPIIQSHLNAVREFRLKSIRFETRELAKVPELWGFSTNQGATYLAVPGVSSESRKYVPIAFLDDSFIASNALLVVSNAQVQHFAILTSAMHNAWIRIVAGRLKSDIRCSASITYNPFPWPSKEIMNSDELKYAAEAVLKSRSELDVPLGQMYSRLEEFPKLNAAHIDCDRVVDEYYGYSGNGSDEHRFGFLLALYEAKINHV